VEAELRASEERLQAVLVAGKMAHWRWDPLSDRMRAAETMAELFGLDAGVRPVLLEGQMLGVVHPDDVAEHQRTVQSAVRNGHGWHREYRVVRPRDAATIWLEESAHAIRDLQVTKPLSPERLIEVVEDLRDIARSAQP
jgi:PAS domain-containing protein